MSFYATTVPAGVPGTLQDSSTSSTVETLILNDANPPLAYGDPVKLDSGKASAIESGDTAASFYGFLVLPNPNKSGNANFNGYGGGTPDVNQPGAVVVGGPGYITVTCGVGTPVKGASVYMRVLTDNFGRLETASDANNVELTNVIWAASGKDSDDAARVRICC